MEDNNLNTIYRTVEKKDDPIIVNTKVAFIDEIVSIKEWFSLFIILSIPIFNVVYVFVKVFFKTKKSKANFYKAYLIYSAIIIICLVVLGLVAYYYGVPVFSNIKYIFS